MFKRVVETSYYLSIEIRKKFEYSEDVDLLVVDGGVATDQ